MIKAARRERKLTQAELARTTGFSLSHVEAVENGRSPTVPYNTILELMNAVGLDIRGTRLNHRRPTLDDIRAEEEEDDAAPRMGR